MGGWMGDHAHVCLIVYIILNLIMKWVVVDMSHTLDLLLFQLVSLNPFNWYQYDIFLYTHICLCFIYVCLHLTQYQIPIDIYLLHTYMQKIYLCLLYPYIFKHKTLFIISLNFKCVSIDLIFNWYLISSIRIFLFGIS